MDPINIRHNTWAFGTKVTVQIDSFFTLDQSAGLKAGNQKWNDPILMPCSGVEFKDFTSIVIAPADYEKTPADGHLVWKEMSRGTGRTESFFLS